MKRRDFVQHVCPSLVFFQLAVTSSACQTDEVPSVPLAESIVKEFESISLKYNDEGFYIQGNQVYVNLSYPNLSKLGNNLGYANLLDAGVLLLRTDEKQ